MASAKTFPICEAQIIEITKKYPTPFYLYDEKSMLNNAEKLYKAFEWAPQFKNYFAVKATPTAGIIDPLVKMGMGLDCSSYAELVIAERLGVRGEEIMFTSNNTPEQDLKKASELGAIINLDDISHIDFLHNLCGMPELICMRYNPGTLKQGNVIIGNPEEAKYGFTREQLFEGFAKARELGATRFALHTMVASNELSELYFIETAHILFELAVELYTKLNIRIEFVNLGGGIGIPYMPDQKAVDYTTVSRGIQREYDSIIKSAGLDPLAIKMENGRVITGPYGILISKVLHKKNIYKQYVGLDATMANLMRPGMYGAYHHISVLGKPDEKTYIYDVTGGLCENNDKFAIDRELPFIETGDFVAIHDVGAHGHSMGFNYNGKLRCAEFLHKTNGQTSIIRKTETYDDYFKTMVW